MTILQANLKHLYQRWTSVLLFLLAGGTSYFLLWSHTLGKGTQGTLSLVCLAVYYLGLFLATIPIEVLTKPFSYCLPGHRMVPARFLFIVGGILCLAWAVPSLFDSEFTRGQAILRLIPRLCTYTIFYWLGVATMLRPRSWGAILWLLPLVLLAIQDSNIPILLERFVFTYAWSVVLLAVLIHYVAYRLLWNNHLARRYCDQFWLGQFDHWNREKIARFQMIRWAGRSEKGSTEPLNSSPRLEKAFLNQITDSGNNLRRHIASGLYRSSASGFIRPWQRLRSMVAFLPLICCFGYLGPVASLGFMMPVIMVTFWDLHLNSSLLISGGRHERFCAALALSVVTTLIITGAFAFLSALSHLLVFVMPDLTFKGLTVTYNPLNSIMLGIPWCMIPLAWTCTVIFHKQKLLSVILPMVAFMIAYPVLIEAIPRPLFLTPLVLVLVTLGAWTVFAGVLRYTCLHRCLGSK